MATTSVSMLALPAGESLSAGIDCRSAHIARIGMPLDWTPAPLSFLVAALPLYPTPPADADYLSLFSRRPGEHGDVVSIRSHAISGCGIRFVDATKFWFFD